MASCRASISLETNFAGDLRVPISADLRILSAASGPSPSKVLTMNCLSVRASLSEISSVSVSRVTF